MSSPTCPLWRPTFLCQTESPKCFLMFYKGANFEGFILLFHLDQLFLHKQFFTKMKEKKMLFPSLKIRNSNTNHS